jgi:hypothetical protein
VANGITRMKSSIEIRQVALFVAIRRHLSIREFLAYLSPDISPSVAKPNVIFMVTYIFQSFLET